jgi:hypothetical protein
MTRPPKSTCPVCNRLIRIFDPYIGTNRPACVSMDREA